MKSISGAEGMKSSGKEAHEVNSVNDDRFFFFFFSEISLSSAARPSTLHEGDQAKQRRFF
jgi:hypothetical protein